MKLDELLKLITENHNIAINQTILAESLGITRQTVSNRLKTGSEVTVSELRKIEEYFGLSLFFNRKNNDDIITVDYYKDVFAS